MNSSICFNVANDILEKQQKGGWGVSCSLPMCLSAGKSLCYTCITIGSPRLWKTIVLFCGLSVCFILTETYLFFLDIHQDFLKWQYLVSAHKQNSPSCLKFNGLVGFPWKKVAPRRQFPFTTLFPLLPSPRSAEHSIEAREWLMLSK